MPSDDGTTMASGTRSTVVISDKVLLPVVRHLGDHEGNGGDRGRAVEAQRIAVGRALGGEVDPGHAAGAGMDLDEDLLAEVGTHIVGKHPGEQVGGATGGESHDQLHRPGRKCLRAGYRRPQQRETECRNEPASHGASPRRFLAGSAPATEQWAAVPVSKRLSGIPPRGSMIARLRYQQGANGLPALPGASGACA